MDRRAVDELEFSQNAQCSLAVIQSNCSRATKELKLSLTLDSSQYAISNACNQGSLDTVNVA